MEAGRLVAKEFQQSHGQRVGLLAGRAARRPHSDRSLVGLALCDDGIHLALQSFKSFEVAEKAGHRNQNIVIQLLCLFVMLLQILRILTRRVKLEDQHAPHCAPLNSIGLVLAEISPTGPSQLINDPGEICRAREKRFNLCCLRFLSHIRVAGDPLQLFRNLLRRQDEVHAPRIDGAAWHAVVLGRFRSLGKCNAPFRLDVFQT